MAKKHQKNASIGSSVNTAHEEKLRIAAGGKAHRSCWSGFTRAFHIYFYGQPPPPRDSVSPPRRAHSTRYPQGTSWVPQQHGATLQALQAALQVAEHDSTPAVMRGRESFQTDRTLEPAGPVEPMEEYDLGDGHR